MHEHTKARAGHPYSSTGHIVLQCAYSSIPVIACLVYQAVSANCPALTRHFDPSEARPLTAQQSVCSLCLRACVSAQTAGCSAGQQGHTSVCKPVPDVPCAYADALALSSLQPLCSSGTLVLSRHNTETKRGWVARCTASTDLLRDLLLVLRDEPRHVVKLVCGRGRLVPWRGRVRGHRAAGAWRARQRCSCHTRCWCALLPAL